jgi:TatD family-associated radical SAM protein
MHFQKKKISIVYWLNNNLYLNITKKCSNNCYFCIKKFKNGIKDFNLRLEQEPKFQEVVKQIQNFIHENICKEIVFCGFGEPLERLDLVLELTKWIKKKFKKIVRINTNGQGYLLNKNRDVISELKEAGVDKIRISLNAHNKEIYNQICKPIKENAFDSILSFIEKSKEASIETFITVVSIPEIKIEKIKNLANKLGVELVIRQYVPFFW